MPRRKNELTEALVTAPYWISLMLAAVSYVFFKAILPSITFNSLIFKGMAAAGVNLAPLAAIFFTFLAIVSFARGLRIKKQFKKQKSVDTLNELSWKAFEDVTGEFFRRRGYSVEEQLRAGADGGVDLRLRKNDQLTLVQCKRWKKQKVNLSIVRELLGAITAEPAQSGIVVTTSTFTRDAIAFARQQGIELIDGLNLTAGIGEIQSLEKKVHSHTSNSTTPPALPPTLPSSSAPACPKCGGVTVLRTAKKGPNAGNDFWGCPSFPRCRGTVSI